MRLPEFGPDQVKLSCPEKIPGKVFVTGAVPAYADGPATAERPIIEITGLQA